MADILPPSDHDREHDYEHEADCWCGPQRFTVREGTLYIHYGPDEEYAPASHVMMALTDMIQEWSEQRRGKG